MAAVQYASKYPNHVHQLMVSVSRHLYAGADGLLKYQKKPMEVTLTKLHASSRRHCIIYTLRDHTSGVLYAELGFSPTLLPLKGFLARAWRKKPDYPFCGLPELLTFPASVRNAFPGIAEEIERLGIGLVGVTSGFQGGVRDIRVIDDAMRTRVGKPLAELPADLAWTYKQAANSVSRRGFERKIDMWRQGVGEVRQLLASDW